MKKNILLSSCLISATLLLSTQASAMAAQKNFYVAIPFGYDFLSKPKSNHDATFSDAKIKNTPFVGLAIGYDFGGVRTELSFNYRNNMKFSINDRVAVTDTTYGTYSAMNVKAYSFMLDIYKDFDIGSEFTPYINGGIGLTRFKTGDYAFTKYRSTTNNPILRGATTSAGKSSDSFAWRVGVGMNYKVSAAVDVGLGYSYNYLGKIKRENPYSLQKTEGGMDSVKFRSNEILASIKFKF